MFFLNIYYRCTSCLFDVALNGGNYFLQDFQKHFCGTHFFNPARYLKLFEIIPGPKTDTDIIEFLYTYGKKFLGKTSVVAKDTPAFIGNRIGIFGIQSLFHQIKEINLTVEEVDNRTPQEIITEIEQLDAKASEAPQFPGIP